VSSLSQDIKKSEGWKRFPIVDILAGLLIAGVAVALEKVYGGNAPLAIALLLAVLGLVVAWPVNIGSRDYLSGSRRLSRKPRDEAIKGIIYGVRIL
jgi:hypothetical protein